jgi:hypothetical protein
MRAKKWARRAHRSHGYRPAGNCYAFEVSTVWIERAGGRALMDASAREPASEYSKGNRVSEGVLSAPALRRLLLGLALVGSLLLIVADFTRLFEVKAVTAVLKREATGSHHLYAMLVIGIAAALLTLAAARSSSKTPAVALFGLALAALLIVVARDLPDVNSTGLTSTYEQAKATPKLGFYLESLGTVLLLVSAGAQLLWGGAARTRTSRRPAPASPDAR